MTTISTLSTMQKSLNNRTAIATQDRDVQTANKELTTGLKADVFSGGNFNAAQSLDLRNRLSRVETFATTNAMLGSKMSVISETLGNIYTDTQEFLSTSLSIGSGNQAAHVLKSSATALMSRLSTYVNTVYAGEYLFSGIDSKSPSLALPQNGFTVGTLANDATLADVQTSLNAVNTYFEFGAAPSSTSFTAEAYPGSTILMASQIDENREISYGFSANDEMFRQIFKGLAMFANTDVSTIENSAVREAWSTEARSSISNALELLQNSQITLGHQEAEVKRAATHQSELSTLYNNRVLDLEGVDGYEAATRLEALSAQLEASYAVTVRLKNLSLLNFL